METITGFLGIIGSVELAFVLVLFLVPGLRRIFDAMGSWVKWALVALGIGLLFFSSYHAYERKALELAALENSAEGMLSVGNVEARASGENGEVRVYLDNRAKNLALRFVPDVILVALDQTELKNPSYEVWPLFSPDQRRPVHVLFPRNLLKLDGQPQTFIVRVQGTYGTVSGAAKYPICEIHFCELNFSQSTDRFRLLDCRIKVCQRDEIPSSADAKPSNTN